ncbi:MAG: NADH:ubiquinone oxidoreductase subunit J [Lysobacterales bacterium]|jgi:NADH-quinone oxidoreductase subunit J|nr:MAG: NADH:ubiquinone oxidoreductase subunit J [Xanthomonadales bacterium]
MNYELVLFYALGGLMLAAAVGVISVRNPVHAVLLLVLAFFTAACLWLLAGAEFLAVALVLVYVGAVMVLFLFVVMMLDVRIEPLRAGFIRYLPLGLFVAALMALEMLAVVTVKGVGDRVAEADPALATGVSNTEWVGRALFTDYLYPFELAGVILTVAIVAAIVLTLRRREGVRKQDPARQVMVRRTDRIRLVKMPAETAREEKG